MLGDAIAASQKTLMLLDAHDRAHPCKIFSVRLNGYRVQLSIWLFSNLSQSQEPMCASADGELMQCDCADRMVCFTCGRDVSS